MITWLNAFLQSDDTKVIYILAIILVANIVDFSIGWINAKFNNKVTFSSSVAIYGIAKKIIMFMLLIMFIPFSLLMPGILGITALYTLYIGYLLSEFTSILSHLRLTKDDKQTDMFANFLGRLFKGGEK